MEDMSAFMEAAVLALGVCGVSWLVLSVGVWKFDTVREGVESGWRRFALRGGLVDGVGNADEDPTMGRTGVDGETSGPRLGVAAVSICSSSFSSPEVKSDRSYSSSSLRRFDGRRIGVMGAGSACLMGACGVDGVSSSRWPCFPCDSSLLAAREGDASPSASITSPRRLGVSCPADSSSCSLATKKFRMLWSLPLGVVEAGTLASPVAAARSSATSAQRKKSQSSSLL